ncbi:hypothetical protein [Streptomyces sp. Qhu_M48]
MARLFLTLADELHLGRAAERLVAGTVDAEAAHATHPRKCCRNCGTGTRR